MASFRDPDEGELGSICREPSDDAFRAGVRGVRLHHAMPGPGRLDRVVEADPSSHEDQDILAGVLDVARRCGS